MKGLALRAESSGKKQKKRFGIRGFWWRVLLALLFTSGLSVFLQLREIKVDVLELHTVSKQYVVAQTAFEFLNEEKTFFLQQQAIHDIGPIYRFDSKNLSKVSSEFEENLIQNQSWRKKMPQVGFEQVYEYTESLENFLLDSRFSDARTIDRMNAAESASEHIFLLPPLKEGETIPVLPETFWITLKEQVFPGDVDPELETFILAFFQERKWDFQRDSILEKRMKQQAKDSVPPQYTLVEAGQFILEPGEKVTLEHVMQLQALKKALGESENDMSPFAVLGGFCLAIIITFLAGVYLKLYHRWVFKSLRRLTLLTVIGLMTLLAAKGTEYLLLYKGYNLIEAIRFPLVVPFAGLLVCVLLGARLALFFSIFLSIIISLGISIEYDRFLVLNLIASMCTIMFARGLYRRKDIFEVCAKVFLCCIPVLIAFHLPDHDFFAVTFLFDIITVAIFMVATAVIVVGFLPLFESIFNIMTDMTLMEYMDPNNELLRRLSLEAPGTYQHSLVVGNLAEIMARSIGANDLFCRVATLYHDIGKLFNPHYFTENQLGGFNIHQLLTPLESTHVIIAHVSEGESLARKHRLPKSFIDVIREHHGTTLVYFFFCKQIEQMEGDVSKVDKSQFRYPGPKPRTKESALIMIADSVEAASRSLDELTEDVVTEMVDRLVAEKAGEGQFDESPLTFQEVCIAKKALIKALLITRHLRVKYPAKGASGE
jgi:cyclic-di-AMP phosphodiesterase PgpH